MAESIQTSDARAAVLSAIRSANGSPPATSRQADWEKLPRDYVRQGQLSSSEVVDLFEHRLLEYDAHVFRTDPVGIAGTIQRILDDRQKKRMLIPAGIAAEWLTTPSLFQTDNGFSYDQLNRFDGVLTAATAAIATTGSLVLQHGSGQGRRAITLIPDYHLCVVFAGQVVETVSQAFDRLDPVMPTTFISGPSATADIEMTRIKGVHGPRFLDVIIVVATS